MIEIINPLTEPSSLSILLAGLMLMLAGGYFVRHAWQTASLAVLVSIAFVIVPLLA